MDQFVKDYGLVAATLLLFFTTLLSTIVTIRMAKVQSREIKFRTKAQLGFGKTTVTAHDWQSLKVEQEVINIGFSFVTVESAVLTWWPYITIENQRSVACTQMLPFHLAPGEEAKLNFEVTQDAFSSIPAGPFSSIDQLISACTTYKYKGLDESVSESGQNLPLPV
jgi:hypothetical protein